MAGAFTLTLTHLAERCEVRTANALAAYVTGVVASNLIGRLTAAFVASLVGAEHSFLFFAFSTSPAPRWSASRFTATRRSRWIAQGRFWSAWIEHLSDPAAARARSRSAS